MSTHVLPGPTLAEGLPYLFASGEVGTGAGEGAPRQDTGSAWVTRSADCPEAPAQAHLPAAESARALHECEVAS